MSAIQNYLSKAQDFSQEVSQEEQLDSAREQVKEKALGNIEQVRDRVEELKAGISGDVKKDFNMENMPVKKQQNSRKVWML